MSESTIIILSAILPAIGVLVLSALLASGLAVLVGAKRRK